MIAGIVGLFKEHGIEWGKKKRGLGEIPKTPCF
jgi:hypothetical protein